MGFLDRLFGRGSKGDGSSAQSAIAVASVAEEYQWVARNLPGWQVEQQALTRVEGKHYDVLSLRRGGETRQVYFDISSFFGKY